MLNFSLDQRSVVQMERWHFLELTLPSNIPVMLLIY